MLDYHNAVSDKLIVCNQQSSNTSFIFDKNNALKFASASLDWNKFIFDHSCRVWMGCNFTLIPEEDSSHEAHLALNHGETTQINTQQLDSIKVVYDRGGRSADRMVNVTEFTDIGVFISYALQQHKQQALYFFREDQSLLIVCINNGQLQLANRYRTENNDELFYYIMLVVEQLNLNAPTLYVGCVSTRGQHEEYLVLFKNYLPSIHLFNANDIVDNDLAQKFPVHFFLSQCVL